MWLAVSVGFAVVASWLRWAAYEFAGHTSHLKRWRAWRGRPWALQILRLVYAIGFPALALMGRGVLTERAFGLQPLPSSVPTAGGSWLNWVTDLGWGTAIVVGAWVLLSLARRTAGKAGPLAPRDSGVAFREAVYHQVHLAFYREPFVLLWGLQAGTWMGLLPALVEGALNPARWADLRYPVRAQDLLLRGALGVVGALLYLRTQNLWMILVADLFLGWVFAVGVVREEALLPVVEPPAPEPRLPSSASVL
jgi:hypothetical protein